MKLYSTISWNVEHGFIKTWHQMKSAELHNGRCTPVAHTVEGAPDPEYLMGTPKIVATARQRLIDHGIDPDNRRAGGNIAREAILSASHEFFFAGSENDCEERLKKWKDAQVQFLTDYFGSHRVISAVVHYDEYTPHVHAIVLALKFDANRQRGRDWSLCGDDMSKLGNFAQHQTDYAQAMAPFGLVRGEVNSRRKRKSHAVYLAEIEALKNSVILERQDLLTQAKIVAKQAREMAEQQASVAEGFIQLRDGWAELRDANLQIAEERREAAAARAAAVSLVEEAAEAQAAVRANERLIEHGFDLLRQQQACIDAREVKLEKRERVLKPGTATGLGHAAIANHHMQMQAGPAVAFGP